MDFTNKCPEPVIVGIGGKTFSSGNITGFEKGYRMN